MMIEEKVKEILLGILDVKEQEISPTATFEDLEATSLDLVQIMTAVENTFGIRIEDSRAAEVTTVGDVIDLLKAKIDGQQAAS